MWVLLPSAQDGDPVALLEPAVLAAAADQVRTPPIDEGIHRADITVDEKGTEAAAVTGIGFAGSGPPPADATMTVDHPFAFAIVHEPCGAPLFEWVVGDPTATQE